MWCLVGLSLLGAEISPTVTLQGAFAHGRADYRDHAVLPALRRVARYYGGAFPVSSLTVKMIPEATSSVGFGQARMKPSPQVILYAGSAVHPSVIGRHWVLTHELLHFGFPFIVEKDLRWLDEGFATYAECIARCQDGVVTPKDLERRLRKQMKPVVDRLEGRRFVAPPGDWSTIYWGGAFFWLLADQAFRAKGSGLGREMGQLHKKGFTMKRRTKAQTLLAELGMESLFLRFVDGKKRPRFPTELPRLCAYSR